MLVNTPPPPPPPPPRHPDNGCVIARSSQPLVGVFGWRNTEDERLLLAISQACHAPSSSSASSSTAEKHGSNVTTTAALYHLKNGGTGGDRHSTEEEKEVEEEEEEADTLESSSELESDGEGGEGVTLNPKLMVFDLRSYTAALGNRAKGGGCEHQGVAHALFMSAMYSHALFIFGKPQYPPPPPLLCVQTTTPTVRSTSKASPTSTR